MIAEELEKRTDNRLLALRQVADLVKRQLDATVRVESGGRSFRFVPRSPATGGILEGRGGIEGDKIAAAFTVARVSETVAVPGSIFRNLGEISGETKLALVKAESAQACTDIVSEVRLDAVPMGPAAENVFLFKLNLLQETSAKVRAIIPEAACDPDLTARWRVMEDAVEVVHPVSGLAVQENVKYWLRQTCNFLISGCNVALVSEYPVGRELGLDLLAGWGKNLGIGLAEVKAGQITPDQVTAMASKAPGCLVVPAVKLSMGTNRYSLAAEASSMLSSLRNSQYPVVFTGGMSELQAVFSGGQGGASDPLDPVLVRIPEKRLPLELMVRFELKKRAMNEGGLSSREENALCGEVMEATEHMETGQCLKLIPMAVARVLRLSRLGLSSKATPLKDAVKSLSSTRETFGGLESPVDTERPADVQRKILSRLTDSELPERLNYRIVGQPGPVCQIVERLKGDILMGRADKPLAVLAVGPSGVGKSMFCKTLASELGMPHVWFNAGQYGSVHTLDALLNGSPTGYVGSYKKGKKERCAGHAGGTVFEVSDLDHASQNVRDYLADGFLEDIDTGRSQTATGVEFPTTGILYFFTVNLPYGLDEKLGRRTGFGPSPDMEEVAFRAHEELKKLFSNAFLGRVGKPVVFGPLDDRCCAVIVERTLSESVRNAARNLEIEAKNIVVSPGLGMQVLRNARLAKSSMGARALAKYARFLVSEAVLKMDPEECRKANLTISILPDGRIGIAPKDYEKEEVEA